jgi:hypothetical protein
MCSHIQGGANGPIPKILLSIRVNSSNGNPHSNFKLTVVYLQVKVLAKSAETDWVFPFAVFDSSRVSFPAFSFFSTFQKWAYLMGDVSR